MTTPVHPRRPVRIVAVGPRPLSDRLLRVYMSFERWISGGDPRFMAMTRMMVPMVAIPIALGIGVATVAAIGGAINQTALSEHHARVEVASRSMIPSHVQEGRNTDGVTGEVLPDTWFIDIKDTAGAQGPILAGKTLRMEVSRAIHDGATPGKAMEVEYVVTRIGRDVVIQGIGETAPGARMEKVPGIRVP